MINYKNITYKNRGFTLIELLLALSIFAIVGIATARFLQQLTSTKSEAFSEIDVYNSVRTAISIIRFDISQAFHILYDDLGSENKQALFQNQEIPHTIFDGRKNQLIFTSLSHRVYYEDKRECEQTEISYFLDEKTNSLMKRESPIIDEKLNEGGEVFPILENVMSLEFSYWDEKQLKWVDDWYSDGSAYRDKFPYSVRLIMVVIGSKGEDLKIETQFKIAFPNNEYFLVTL